MSAVNHPVVQQAPRAARMLHLPMHPSHSHAPPNTRTLLWAMRSPRPMRPLPLAAPWAVAREQPTLVAAAATAAVLLTSEPETHPHTAGEAADGRASRGGRV